MRDPQKLIDDIHGFIGRADQAMTDDLRSVAFDFHELGTLAEARLRRCEDYLRRGLVGEAIHLAEVEPPLLEIVGALDFPGRPQWEEILSAFGLPVPPAVNLTRAAALNQAYELHRTLEPSLREYRRLCLGHAPLGERMAVLRKLAAADPGNPAWLDDLALYEAPALEEMQAALKGAGPRRDPAALADVARRLQGGGWSSPQAGLLMQQVQQELATLHAQQARQSLQQLGRALDAAMKQNDPVAVTAAYQALYAGWQGAGLPAEDPVSVQLTRAASWVQAAQQRAQQRADFDTQMTAFEALLAGGRAGEDDLEVAFGRLERLGLPIPDPVRKGYRKAAARCRQERNARARHWDRLLNATLLVIAMPVALLVLAVVGVILYRMLHTP